MLILFIKNLYFLKKVIIEFYLIIVSNINIYNKLL